MTKEAAGAFAVLLAGIGLEVIVVMRARSGRSYMPKPAMQVDRKTDPFSFWLSLLFPAGFALVLTAVGVAGLWHSLISN